MPEDLIFTFNGENIEIVKQFSYLGIVYTSGDLVIKLRKHCLAKH